MKSTSAKMKNIIYSSIAFILAFAITLVIFRPKDKLFMVLFKILAMATDWVSFYIIQNPRIYTCITIFVLLVIHSSTYVEVFLPQSTVPSPMLGHNRIAMMILGNIIWCTINFPFRPHWHWLLFIN